MLISYKQRQRSGWGYLSDNKLEVFAGAEWAEVPSPLKYIIQFTFVESNVKNKENIPIAEVSITVNNVNVKL